MPRRRLRDWIVRRRAILIPVGAVLVGLVVFVFVWFEPHKLFIDDTVDDPAPIGAVPIAAADVASTVTPPTTSPATAVPATTIPATTIPVTTSPVTTSPSTAVPPTPTPTTATPPTTTTPPAATTTIPPATTTPPPPVAEFISRDHGTSGRAVVLRDAAGVVYLRLEDLDTDNGPDLYVYLTTNPADGPEQGFDDDYVDLGRLQGNKGNQNYVVPDGTDLLRYSTVVIWCDRFNSAFGAATFPV